MLQIAHGVKNKDEAKIALKKGYDQIEVDVAKRIIFTKFTITHDAIPGKLGFGPTLESLLLSKYKSKLFLDIKHASYSLRFTSRIVKLLKLTKSEGVKICGYDWKIISDICKQTKSLPYYTIKEKNHLAKIKSLLPLDPQRSEDRKGRNFPYIVKPVGFSVFHQILDKNFIQEIKSEHPTAQIWAWTPDRKSDINKLKKLKTDGIITNNWRK